MSEDNERKLFSPLDQQKWKVERGFREREVAAKERELILQEADLDLRRKAQASQWHNPLVMAIFAAAISLISNSVLTYLNGQQTLKLESNKAEFSRVADMLKTGGDPDKAAALLTFLVDVKLLKDPDVVAGLRDYVAHRKPGSGVSLPSPVKRTTLSPEPPLNEMHTVLTAYTLMLSGIEGASLKLRKYEHNANASTSLGSEALQNLKFLAFELAAEKSRLIAEQNAYHNRALYISPFTMSDLQQIEALVRKLETAEMSTENIFLMINEVLRKFRSMRLAHRQIEARE